MVNKIIKNLISLSIFTKCYIACYVIIVAMVIFDKIYPIPCCNLDIPGEISTVLPIIMLTWSILYLIIGAVRLLYEKTHNIKKIKTWNTKSMFNKGVYGIVSLVLFYLIMPFFLLFFGGLSIGGCMCLPQI